MDASTDATVIPPVGPADVSLRDVTTEAWPDGGADPSSIDAGSDCGCGILCLRISPLNPTIALGASMLFTASGMYADGTQVVVTDQFTWTSSNVSVATLSAPGIVASALGEGVTTIAAIFLGCVVSTELTVVSPVF
jgi:hypothetical protein